MSAYVLVDVDVTDPAAYDSYKAAGAEAVQLHGGRYLARGGEVTTLEGGWSPSRMVVLEFPDADTARRWYDSDHYRHARALRRGAADVRMVVVEGAE